jgi:hypothetical protein
MAWAVTPQCWPGGRNGSPAQRVLRRTPLPQRSDTAEPCPYTMAVGTCLRHVLLRAHRAESRPTPLGCRGPLHDTNTHGNLKSAPAESAAVCAGKLQSKGLGFGADCKAVSRFHTLLTHRNLRHAGRRLKRVFRFRKVLWLLSSKESNNKNKHGAQFASWRGP